MNVLAIIPARGGSVGIPRKNIQKLNGHPLISYTIQHAKKSKIINKIVVSTDDEKISKISKSLNVEVPFKRPKKLSSNNSSVIDVVVHTLSFLEKNQSYIPDIIVLLQPTSPFRKTSTIDSMIELLINSKSDSVISVFSTPNNFQISFHICNNYLKQNNSNFESLSLRQNRDTILLPSGTVYAFWNKTLKKYNSIYGKKIKPILPRKDDIIIDIDTIEDLFFTEMFLKYWSTYKKCF